VAWPAGLLEELHAYEAVLFPARVAVLLERRACGLGSRGHDVDVRDGVEDAIGRYAGRGLPEKDGRYQDRNDEKHTCVQHIQPPQMVITIDGAPPV